MYDNQHFDEEEFQHEDQGFMETIELIGSFLVAIPLFIWDIIVSLLPKKSEIKKKE